MKKTLLREAPAWKINYPKCCNLNLIIQNAEFKLIIQNIFY